MHVDLVDVRSCDSPQRQFTESDERQGLAMDTSAHIADGLTDGMSL